MPLTLYHVIPSRGAIARWMLEEIGEPYEVRLLDWNTGENRQSVAQQKIRRSCNAGHDFAGASMAAARRRRASAMTRGAMLVIRISVQSTTIGRLPTTA